MFNLLVIIPIFFIEILDFIPLFNLNEMIQFPLKEIIIYYM
jgi:hypothetical protein